MHKPLFIVPLLLLTFHACGQEKGGKQNKDAMEFEISKSEAEWKKELTPEEYRILREKGTERAFTGAFVNHKKDGTFTCAACGNPLFSSETKYDSRSGWPSFYAPLKESNIRYFKDNSFGDSRIEVVCNKCGGHLGHVFEDGPQPTGQRYCINSASLDFTPEKP